MFNICSRKYELSFRDENGRTVRIFFKTDIVRMKDELA